MNDSLKQHLVLINGRFMTQRITGVQRSAGEVICALVNKPDNEFRFIIAAHGSDILQPVPGIEIYNDNSFLPVSVWQQVRLPILMRRLNAAMLWSPCNTGPLSSANHVVTIHDTAPFAGPKWFSYAFRTYYRGLLPLLGRRAEMIVTPSIFSKDEIIRHRIAPAEKICVIPGGVSPAFSPHKSRRNERPFLLTVGSRDPRKNIPMLIEAWKKIPEDIKSDRILLITGDKADIFSPENLGNLPDDISFTGYIDDESLIDCYSSADAFVFPSLYEGFGFPPLEAMACGCPVITSNLASLPEVCGDSAYYIDPYSVKSITDGIVKVLSDQDLRDSLIQKGLKRAKLFTWDRSAEKHLMIFKEILQESL